MSARHDSAAGGRARSAGSSGAAHRRPRQAVPLLEWIVGAVGAALVGGAVAFLVYHSLTRDRTPPDISLVAERVLDLEDGYLVQFRASNRGGSTAAQLTIEGELASEDGDTETSEATLDYLPPRSDREGGLMFSRDPRAGQLSLRAKGYAHP
jgi:uncharacterized protein (TIGR02588 family)